MRPHLGWLGVLILACSATGWVCHLLLGAGSLMVSIPASFLIGLTLSDRIWRDRDSDPS